MTLNIHQRQTMKVVKTTYYVAISPEKLREFLTNHMHEFVDEDQLQDTKFPAENDSRNLTCTITVNGYLEVAWDVIKES